MKRSIDPESPVYVFVRQLFIVVVVCEVERLHRRRMLHTLQYFRLQYSTFNNQKLAVMLHPVKKCTELI